MWPQVRVDFRGLRIKASCTVSTACSRSDDRPWPGFLWITHSVSVKRRCHRTIADLLGEFFSNFVRKRHCTTVAERVSSFPKQQNARSPPLNSAITVRPIITSLAVKLWTTVYLYLENLNVGRQHVGGNVGCFAVNKFSACVLNKNYKPSKSSTHFWPPPIEWFCDNRKNPNDEFI